MPTVRAADIFQGAEAQLGNLDLDARGDELVGTWVQARRPISHDGVRTGDYADATRLLDATADLVRHLQGSSSGVALEDRRTVSAQLRSGADVLVSTAVEDLSLALDDPVGVASTNVNRAKRSLGQASHAYDRAQSPGGSDVAGMAHLSTAWRKLLGGVGDLGIDLAGDVDGDGLSNHVEFVIGSNVFDGDSDADGLTDAFEVGELLGRTSSVIADSDDDGVGDAAEDEDGDALSNYDEQRFGSRPLEADSDDDASTDAQEQRVGTDAARADTDGDGLADGVEPPLGLSPTNHDTDGDGVPDDRDAVEARLSGPGEVSATIRGRGDLVTDAAITALPATEQTTGVPGQASPAYEFQISDHAVERMTSGVITLPFDVAQVSPADARVFYLDQDEGLWRPAEGKQSVDAADSTVSTTVEHFSTYAVFDATAWERRWAGHVSCIGRSGANLDIALILDSSGSMAKNDPEGRRLDAARAVVDSMLAGDRAAVVDFDSDGQLLQELTTSKASLRRAISDVDADGSPTNIGTGVRTALDELLDRGRSTAVRGAILIADGAGNYNPALTDQARDAGIIINTVGLGDDSDFTVLKAIAAGTGGKFVRVGRADQLPDVFRRLADNTGGEEVSDTDEDGLSDCLETTGILAANGRTYYTNPHDADTDHDGLTDGEEVGERVDFARLGEDIGIPALTRLGDSGSRVYSLRSYPTLVDSDDDGLLDATELDDRTRLFDGDSDHDSIGDATERAIGTNPWWPNTDGDSFTDAYEYTHSGDGLKPLFYDRKVSKLSYLADFVRGFTLGDLLPKESTAWLAGSLTSSFIPLVDIRDILGNGTRGDWVG
ncbi:MAG TPA: VWA domain-containing protein, partial [Candidatus Limnocylindrales bacterium]|nr:VWA domain-containing protein [Candidatus Limnocylindrales bacterium]